MKSYIDINSSYMIYSHLFPQANRKKEKEREKKRLAKEEKERERERCYSVLAYLDDNKQYHVCMHVQANIDTYMHQVDAYVLVHTHFFMQSTKF